MTVRPRGYSAECAIDRRESFFRFIDNLRAVLCVLRRIIELRFILTYHFVYFYIYLLIFVFIFLFIYLSFYVSLYIIYYIYFYVVLHIIFLYNFTFLFLYYISVNFYISRKYKIFIIGNCCRERYFCNVLNELLVETHASFLFMETLPKTKIFILLVLLLL